MANEYDRLAVLEALADAGVELPFDPTPGWLNASVEPRPARLARRCMARPGMSELDLKAELAWSIVACWYAGSSVVPSASWRSMTSCTPAGRDSFSRRVSAVKAGRLAHVLARTRLASPLGRPRAYSRASQPP